jgi:transcription elongation factor GreA
MNEEIMMSQSGLDALKEELADLKNEKMPEIIQRIDAARQLGDLSENAEYHEAKDDQGLTAARIRELEVKIQRAVIVEKESDGTVNIGSKIDVVGTDGDVVSFEIVDQTQADPLEGKISNESPMGSAFIGKKEGDAVEVDLPAGMKMFTIKKVS